MEAYRYLAKVYDYFMHDVDYKAWAEYLHDFLRQYNVKKILEVSCGTGSITRHLYNFGYEIIASDISTEMLKMAKQSAKEYANDIQFIRQDMRNIEVGNRVDAIVCACDGVNYINADGLSQFAVSAFHGLKDGGVLLFDISSRYKLKDIMDEQVFFDDAEESACIWQNTFDDEHNALLLDITLFIKRGKLFERYSEQHIQYVHDVKKIKDIILEAGFSNVDTYKCFTKENVCTEDERIQFICNK